MQAHLHMTPAARAQHYAQVFPDYPAPRVDARWLDSVWVLGNNYRGSGIYGAYPPGYIKRVAALFPDARDVLHLFSGSLSANRESLQHPEHWQCDYLDANPELHPTIIGSAEAMPVEDARYDLVLADPPYSVEDAQHYGKPMANRSKVLEEAYRVLRPGGCLLWLDQVLPMYSKAVWHLWGLIAVVRSTNHRVRLLSCFQRPSSLEDHEWVSVAIPGVTRCCRCGMLHIVSDEEEMFFHCGSDGRLRAAVASSPVCTNGRTSP